MNDCMFYFSEGHCKILKIQKCERCRFKKTSQEYNDAQRHSREILKSKGLRVVERHNACGEHYITVVKERKNEN